MHSPLIAIALCMFVGASGAQCVGASYVTHDATQAGNGIEAVKVSTAAPKAQGAPKAGGGLITAAAAGTRDVPGAQSEATSMTRSPGKRMHDGEDHPRRGGTAMLLAALALMSGIALRRFGSS